MKILKIFDSLFGEKELEYSTAQALA